MHVSQGSLVIIQWSLYDWYQLGISGTYPPAFIAITIVQTFCDEKYMKISDCLEISWMGFLCRFFYQFCLFIVTVGCNQNHYYEYRCNSPPQLSNSAHKPKPQSRLRYSTYKLNLQNQLTNSTLKLYLQTQPSNSTHKPISQTKPKNFKSLSWVYKLCFVVGWGCEFSFRVKLVNWVCDWSLWAGFGVRVCKLSLRDEVWDFSLRVEFVSWVYGLSLSVEFERWVCKSSSWVEFVVWISRLSFRVDFVGWIPRLSL